MSNLYELKDIKQYYEGKKVLDIKELFIKEGEIIGFFGPNGSGKSTLFSLLAFIENPYSGSLIFDEIDRENISKDVKKDIVLVPQNPYLLKRTVYENITYGLKIRDIKTNFDKKVKEALHLVGLDYCFAKRKWNQLSGGEAQRVALAARLILKPKVLILDEPTTGVDVSSTQLIKEAIVRAKRKYNTTILISSHDHTWLNHICDKKVALFQGNIILNNSFNLLFAPWLKDKDLNLIKEFGDGQKLIIENSRYKKRDSVAILNSEDIHLFKNDYKRFDETNVLKAKVLSLHNIKNENSLNIELSISGVNFNTKIKKGFIKGQTLMPGDSVDIYINTKNICWI